MVPPPYNTGRSSSSHHQDGRGNGERGLPPQRGRTGRTGSGGGRGTTSSSSIGNSEGRFSHRDDFGSMNHSHTNNNNNVY